MDKTLEVNLTAGAIRKVIWHVEGAKGGFGYCASSAVAAQVATARWRWRGACEPTFHIECSYCMKILYESSNISLNLLQLTGISYLTGLRTRSRHSTKRMNMPP